MKRFEPLMSLEISHYFPRRLIARKMRTSTSATTTGQSHISNSHNTTTNNFTKPVLKSWWITSNEVLIHLRMNLFSQKGWICLWLGCCLFHPIKKNRQCNIERGELCWNNLIEVELVDLKTAYEFYKMFNTLTTQWLCVCQKTWNIKNN